MFGRLIKRSAGRLLTALVLSGCAVGVSAQNFDEKSAPTVIYAYPFPYVVYPSAPVPPSPMLYERGVVPQPAFGPGVDFLPRQNAGPGAGFIDRQNAGPGANFVPSREVFPQQLQPRNH